MERKTLIESIQERVFPCEFIKFFNSSSRATFFDETERNIVILEWTVLRVEIHQYELEVSMEIELSHYPKDLLNHDDEFSSEYIKHIVESAARAPYVNYDYLRREGEVDERRHRDN